MISKTRRACLATLAACLFTVPAWGADSFVVEYRASHWVTRHFDDPGKAQAHFDTVKKLRCEAKMFDHDGHKDVRYRCTKWESLSTKTDDGAHRWENWLKAAGFETKHEH